MKKLATIFGAILVATVLSFADAKFGVGLCPDLMNAVAYSPEMAKISGMRFHYLDKLLFNLYTLANMFAS